MSISQLKTFLGATLLLAPLIGAIAVPTHGEAAGARSAGFLYSPSHKGTTRTDDQDAIEDALADVSGGVLPDEDLAVLRTVPAVGAPDGAETIFGKDTRKRVRNTKKWPYSAIVRITYSDGTNDYHCSGWMLDKDTVATAGHCLHVGNSGAAGFYPVRSYRIYPGANGAITPYGSCRAKKLFVSATYARKGYHEYDYGAIKLNCNVGKKTGWIGFFYRPGSLKGYKETISGYPGDKKTATQWMSSDRVRSSTKFFVFYKNDLVSDAMAGSPVYTDRYKKCGTCSLAVHAAEASGSVAPYVNHNQGVRISRSAFRNLKRWMKK